MARTVVMTRAAAGMLAAGLFAAGCSDGERDPDTAEPATSAPASSPSSPMPTGPEPTPWPEPTRPVAMERDDIQGAKAAAEYFLSLYPYVYVTGDVEPWREMSHPECQFCAGVVENVEGLHSDGGFADGPAIEFVNGSAQAPTDNYPYFSVRIEALEHASSRYDGGGDLVASQPGGTIDAEMAMEHADGGWRVRGAVVTPRGEGGA